MKQSFAHLDSYRLRFGPYRSPPGAHWGAFMIPYRGERLLVIAGDPDDPLCEGWEHVSVSLPKCCPTWAEMCHVKALFWDADEVVMQLHVDGSRKVNLATTCLHLWRPPAGVSLPPRQLV